MADTSMSNHPTGTKVFEGDPGSAAMTATQRGTAAAFTVGSKASTLSATDWLALAATPTFAIMALLTVFLGGSEPGLLCLSAHDASPLSGMLAMYLLMSAFHSAPWFKLVFNR